ncbi:MAG: SpoIIE family protein phosphatase [Desulfobacula sp.]|nr:SpoIIE family protein phosphatase [Desulfobacula sp.]
MNNHLNQDAIQASSISLMPYYVLGVVGTGMGIVVVAVLNFFTPLEPIQDLILGQYQTMTLNRVMTHYLPRFLLISGLAFFAVFTGINRMLRPISLCLNLLKKGARPSPDIIEAAKRRLLNLPILVIPVNVLMWVIIPSLVALYTTLAGFLDHRTVITLSARASMVGLIASGIASHYIEVLSRRQLIPFFFPQGQLAQLEGVTKISLSRRIRATNRLIALIPVTVLLVTLMTLQWEIETYPVKAVNYGRGIIVFTFVLFIWTFVFSKQLTRLLCKNIVDPINELALVLMNVRKGRFDQSVRVVSGDEIGFAGDVVNEMTQGLQEREMMQKSLNLAREIQQNLLPKHDPVLPGLDIAGKIIYCDETGGDYYDYLLPEIDTKDRIRIVLGDVSGHGVASALLMATSRALFRQRSAMPGNLAQAVTDVNRHLCRDVEDSGNFITFFGIELDLKEKCLKWVRAGHDPAVLYDPEQESFTELKGEGAALGLDDSLQYKENSISTLAGGRIIALYTDGIWEARNPSGQKFGKDNLHRIIRENAGRPSREILELCIGASRRFQGEAGYQDDITLIIVKISIDQPDAPGV